MDAIQKTGKTVDEAVALALGELGITKDEAEIRSHRGRLQRISRNVRS